jgi:hypothetical protein
MMGGLAFDLRNMMARRWLSLAGKLALSAICLAMLFSQVDLAATWKQATAVDLRWLLLATVLMALQVLISSLRWSAVLAAIGSTLPLRALVPITFISLFFNLALPASVGGDAVRIWKSTQRGLPLSSAVNGVLLERVASVLGTVALLLASAPVFRARLPAASSFGVILAALGAGAAGLVLLMFMDRLPAAWQRWRVVRGAFQLAHDTRRLFSRPRESAVALGLAVGGQLNLALIAFILALGVGAPLQLLDAVLLMPLVVLVSSLPISVSGWGVREGAMVVAFGLAGVPASSALLLSILLGLVSTVISLGGGVLWWLDADPPDGAPQPAPTAPSASAP